MLRYIGLVAFAVLGVWLLIRLLAAPLRGLVKFLLHFGSGLLLLLIVNFVGGYFGFYIPFTWPNLLISGLGGAPGTALLALYHLLF